MSDDTKVSASEQNDEPSETQLEEVAGGTCCIPPIWTPTFPGSPIEPCFPTDPTIEIA